MARMIEAIEEFAREQARSQAEKCMRERYGIPENTLWGALEAVVYQMDRSNEMFAQVKKLAKQMHREARINVSPTPSLTNTTKRKGNATYRH